jgi:hypothetical protein
MDVDVTTRRTVISVIHLFSFTVTAESPFFAGVRAHSPVPYARKASVLRSRYWPSITVRRQYMTLTVRKIVLIRTGSAWRVSGNGNERRKTFGEKASAVLVEK